MEVEAYTRRRLLYEQKELQLDLDYDRKKAELEEQAKKRKAELDKEFANLERAKDTFDTELKV